MRRKQCKDILVIQVRIAGLAKDPDHSPSHSITPGTSAVEMNKFPPPSFSEKCIEYPELKRSWNKIAAQAWDDNNQIEQMKNNVDSFTKKIIQRCRNMKEVWEALDHEYAQEQ